MANITLPQPNIPLGTGKCPNCQSEVEVKLSAVWYKKILEIVKLINSSL
jgi:hypothetical protein